MSTIYVSPEDFDLKTIGEVDFSDGCYQFDLTVLWLRESDGLFLYGDDSGCSCPSPFEDMGMQDLTSVGSLADFQGHMAERLKDAYGNPTEIQNDIVRLIELAREAGLR